MQWIRVWPGTPGYRNYLDVEKFTQMYADVVQGSSPVVWAVFGIPTSGVAARLDLGEFTSQADANEALDRFVESL